MAEKNAKSKRKGASLKIGNLVPISGMTESIRIPPTIGNPNAAVPEKASARRSVQRAQKHSTLAIIGQAMECSKQGKWKSLTARHSPLWGYPRES